MVAVPMDEDCLIIERFTAHLDNIKKSKVGCQAYDFTLDDIDGNIFSLKEYRGKYVLLDFWIIKCWTSLMMRPYFMDVKERYKNEEFEIISISVDSERKEWEITSKSIEMTWPSLIYDGVVIAGGTSLIDEYNANSLPTMILVDKTGKIIFRSTDGNTVDALDAKLKEILE